MRIFFSLLITSLIFIFISAIGLFNERPDQVIRGAEDGFFNQPGAQTDDAELGTLNLRSERGSLQLSYELSRDDISGGLSAIIVTNEAAVRGFLNGVPLRTESVDQASFSGVTLTRVEIDLEPSYSLPGRNTLGLQLRSEDRAVFLRSVRIDPKIKVTNAFRQNTNWLRSLQRLSSALGLIALLSGLLWSVFRFPDAQALGLAFIGAWLAFGLYLPPSSQALWPVLMPLGLFAGALFANSLRRVTCVICLIALLFYGASFVTTTGELVSVYFVPLAGLALAFMGVRANRLSVVVTCSFIVCTVLSGLHFPVLRGGSYSLATYGFLLVALSTVVAAVIVGWIRQLYQTYRGDRDAMLRTIESQKAALDQEIRRAAVLEERQRLVRDMHDGVGGHLQTLLMQLRHKSLSQNEMRNAVQRGLTDLRLIVDSLDNVGENFGAAIATFRTRIRPQVEAVGFRIDWTVSAHAEALRLSSEKTLSIYRMLQECVFNALRHSGGDQIRLQIFSLDDTLKIIVADNGRGLGDEISGGRGLKNLEARAVRLGGSVELEADNVLGGLRVTFSLPIGVNQSKTAPTLRPS